MAERPEDLNLPITVVQRIIKESLPDGVIVSKEARQTISRASSVFVLYLTACAVAHANKAKRKTLAVNDIFSAISDMEFDSFNQPLKDALKYRKESGAAQLAANKNKNASSPTKASANKTDADADEEDDDVEEIENEVVAEETDANGVNNSKNDNDDDDELNDNDNESSPSKLETNGKPSSNKKRKISKSDVAKENDQEDDHKNESELSAE